MTGSLSHKIYVEWFKTGCGPINVNVYCSGLSVNLLL
jgi:hypothetical protein